MKNEEVLIHTADVKVRIITLQPGEAAPLHMHSEVTDHMFGLSGQIAVIMKGPDETVKLTAGTRCTVEKGRLHQVRNLLPAEHSEYLLVQGVGKYDFISVEPESPSHVGPR